MLCLHRLFYGSGGVYFKTSWPVALRVICNPSKDRFHLILRKWLAIKLPALRGGSTWVHPEAEAGAEPAQEAKEGAHWIGSREDRQETMVLPAKIA